MNGWLEELGFLPLGDDELLRIRHALNAKADALRASGDAYDASLHVTLCAKLGDLHGLALKIAPRDEDDETALHNTLTT